MVTLITLLSTVAIGQNGKIKPIVGSNNFWGYQDLNRNIVVNPIFDVVTPMINNFYEIAPQQLDMTELLLNSDNTFFRNPIGVVIKGDSLGIVDHQGKFLLNPLKCKLRTIVQNRDIKIVENLEEASEDYGKIALISESGLFITPFMMCQLEEYEGSSLEPHEYYYRHNAVEDFFLTGCKESYNIFINQTDGFIKYIPDSLYIVLATDGYYFVKNGQIIDLFHNDTYIKSIILPENYHHLIYYTNGIFSVKNEEQNTILMDTSGSVYYSFENGYLEGINDHGHARIGQNNKILYIDNKGRQVFETNIGVEYFSNKEGYHLYEGDSIVYYDKMFNKISNVISKNEEDNYSSNAMNYDVFLSLCHDSFYYIEMIRKNTPDFKYIKTHEFENGKYNIIEFVFYNAKYLYTKCSTEPFFPYENIYNFEYIGNDIFFIYIDNQVIVYHYLNGELSKFDYQNFDNFIFQGKKYYYANINNEIQNFEIYDNTFKKFSITYNNIQKTYDGIECRLSPSIENGKFVFEIFGHKGLINFEKLDPNFALENIKFWHYRNMSTSYSIFMGIRDTFSFHIVELNFPNIIEAPQVYEIHQFSLEFDPSHSAQTLKNFINSKNLVNTTILDSLICVKMSDEQSICLNLNKRIITKIDNDALHPERYAYYYNRRVKFDCFDVGYTDKQGKQVIPLIYNANDWTSFRYGVAIVTRLKNQELEYGLIDTIGSLLIPFSDYRLKFDHQGKIVIKEYRNSDSGYIKYYFYDLTGKFLDKFNYVESGSDFLFASLPFGGYRVFIGDFKSYIDVDKAVVKNDQLWVKKDSLEFIFSENKLIPWNEPNFNLDKGSKYKLNEKMTIMIDGEFLIFVHNNQTLISFIEGSVSKIDYNNSFVYIEDKFRDIVLYNFKGEKLFDANHSDIEYFPQYKLFILKNYDDIENRSIYRYYYID